MDKSSNAEVQRVLDYLSKIDPSSEEYTRAVQNLKVLLETTKVDKWNLELWAPLTVQLLGLVLILQHENLHVITTRAFSWFRR